MDRTQTLRIPIVDLKEGAQSGSDPAPDALLRVGRQLTEAFSDIGFAYVTNHGIPEEMITRTFRSTGEFFELPLEEKEKLSRLNCHGYVAVDREKLSAGGDRHELRESFDVQYSTDRYPHERLPDFGPSVRQLIAALDGLTGQLLLALQTGLNVKDNLLVKSHANMLDCSVNSTIMRVLYYPPVPAQRPPGTLRCGAHTDYGTITILLQDNLGGLEVKTRSGVWEPAPPVDGALLINVGDLLQHWTGDRLVATEHRVLVPEAELLQQKPRRSIAYFIHPDDAVMIEPLDGRQERPPVNAKEWLMKRFAETYQY
ncbi:Non-hem dioxygenase N-terminal domain [Trinorchestia longiramus]|nr:Non-hem dioxygenase N-terminal domain [Trinorchestia longiramus]